MGVLAVPVTGCADGSDEDRGPPPDRSARTASRATRGESRPAPSPPDGLAVLVNRSARPGDYYDVQFCGAVLVAPRLVLTAGHCLDDRDPRQVAILIGVAELCDPDVLERRLVDRAVQTNAMRRVDLVGLRLAGASTIAPVRLIARGDPAQPLSAFGFGLRDLGVSAPCRPKQVRLRPTDVTACRDLAHAGRRRFDPGAELCTLPAAAGGANTCLRDSGSPVLAYRHGTALLVAVVTWGAGCASDDVGVNARASTAHVIDR